MLTAVLTAAGTLAGCSPQTENLSETGGEVIQEVPETQIPMERVEGAERGAGEFERITWDEAIDEIARRWKSYCDEFGSESIAVVSGSGNYHLASGVALGASGIQRFKTPSCSSLRAFWPAGTWRCIWPPTRRGSAGSWGEMCSAL